MCRALLPDGGLTPDGMQPTTAVTPFRIKVAGVQHMTSKGSVYFPSWPTRTSRHCH